MAEAGGRNGQGHRGQRSRWSLRTAASG